jgi:alkylation response protein AidB-like acyl-CoA dehydrogenase
LAAVAKAYCNETALRVTSEAIQVHGGYGFTDEFPVSRFYRGARYARWAAAPPRPCAT